VYLKSQVLIGSGAGLATASVGTKAVCGQVDALFVIYPPPMIAATPGLAIVFDGPLLATPMV
jgi:hypothetical protein